jgi:hypothetical protein
MTKFIIAFTILLFSLNCFCQSSKKRKNIRPDVAVSYNTDSLLQTINPDYCIATADFSGGTLSKDIITTISGSDLFKIEKTADSINSGKGAFILFYDIKLIDGRKDTVKQYFDNFSWSVDSLQKQIIAYDKVNEIKHLMKLNLVSGVVYFSGWDFHNVMIVSAQSGDLLYNCFRHTGPGSVIVFENSVFQNKDGSLMKPLNKTVRLGYLY